MGKYYKYQLGLVYKTFPEKRPGKTNIKTPWLRQFNSLKIVKNKNKKIKLQLKKKRLQLLSKENVTGNGTLVNRHCKQKEKKFWDVMPFRGIGAQTR